MTAPPGFEPARVLRASMDQEPPPVDVPVIGTAPVKMLISPRLVTLMPWAVVRPLPPEIGTLIRLAAVPMVTEPVPVVAVTLMPLPAIAVMLPLPVVRTVMLLVPGLMATASVVPAAVPVMVTPLSVTTEDTVAGPTSYLILSPLPLQVSV